jgi:hypothetical protein
MELKKIAILRTLGFKTRVTVGLFLVYSCIVLLDSSCKKQNEFLDAKPNGSLSTISTLSDLQNILNNQQVFNYLVAPGLGETSSDDYYVTSAVWLSRLTATDQNTYIWAQKIYPAGSDVQDWTKPYNAVYYANTVLDAIPNIKIGQDQQAQSNQIKGAALFYRSIAFYDLVQTFALPYDSVNAGTVLGIPLRLSSDLNIKSTRSSEKDCYTQITTDLEQAVKLLPNTSEYPEQPNKVSANALLARVYLSMSNFKMAFQFSDAALSLNNSLLDFNANLNASPDYFSASSNYPLKEDIFHYLFNGTPAAFGSKGIVDSLLYASYDSNDLRKTEYFTTYSSAIRFKGSYEFKLLGYDFCGLATDELYLIRAESNARLGNTVSALTDLNALLVTRWKTGTFIPFAAPTADSALTLILSERRKELLDRGLRWTDLRRLNKEGRYAITLTRVINGTTYTLPPNDPRYALPIPDDEIQTSGIQQNAR